MPVWFLLKTSLLYSNCPNPSQKFTLKKLKKKKQQKNLTLYPEGELSQTPSKNPLIIQVSNAEICFGFSCFYLLTID